MAHEFSYDAARSRVVMIKDSPGTVVTLDLARRPSEDSGLNAEWDRLLVLVTHAWCWRDPESVDAVEDCLRTLRSFVERDWA